MADFVFIGLGNPGSQFEGTRHNLGIAALRAWVVSMKDQAVVIDWHKEERYQAEIARVRIPGGSATCIFPLTFMNDSGHSVVAFQREHAVVPERLLIIHDDVELPLGAIALGEGSAKGHNGVRSIQAEVGVSDIPRLRLGVGRPSKQMPLDRYVLERFSKAEKSAVERMVEEAGTVLLKKLVDTTTK